MKAKRAAMASAIVSDHAITSLQEEKHLRIPIIRREGPPVVEDNRLTCAPILVEDLCSVFGRDKRHGSISCGLRRVAWGGSGFRTGCQDGCAHGRGRENAGCAGQHISTRHGGTWCD